VFFNHQNVTPDTSFSITTSPLCVYVVNSVAVNYAGDLDSSGMTFTLSVDDNVVIALNIFGATLQTVYDTLFETITFPGNVLTATFTDNSEGGIGTFLAGCRICGLVESSLPSS
jgi:hypothetical protein